MHGRFLSYEACKGMEFRIQYYLFKGEYPNPALIKMNKNIFLTGAPSSGKTTVIKKIIKGLSHPAKGFYTEEEKKDDKRIGFMMKTLDGKSGYLGHESIPSAFRIRRYGVSIENIEHIAVPSIRPEKNCVVILDEIGRMECFSQLFKDAVISALDSPSRVIGTIALGGGDFIRSIKERGDVSIIEVTPDNRDNLPGHILNLYTM